MPLTCWSRAVSGYFCLAIFSIRRSYSLIRSLSDSTSRNSGPRASRRSALNPCMIFPLNCCVPHLRSRSPWDFTNPRAALTRAVRARVDRRVYSIRKVAFFSYLNAEKNIFRWSIPRTADVISAPKNRIYFIKNLPFFLDQEVLAQIRQIQRSNDVLHYSQSTSRQFSFKCNIAFQSDFHWLPS